jgi:hypothetical protein
VTFGHGLTGEEETVGVGRQRESSLTQIAGHARDDT